MDDLFPSFWIGRYIPKEKPARYLYFTVPDIFLWGFVTNKVNEIPVSNITQLKLIIETDIKSITYEVLNNVWRNLETRLRAIIRKLIGHIQHNQYHI